MKLVELYLAMERAINDCGEDLIADATAHHDGLLLTLVDDSEFWVTAKAEP